LGGGENNSDDLVPEGERGHESARVKVEKRVREKEKKKKGLQGGKKTWDFLPEKVMRFETLPSGRKKGVSP